jgi:hypothetical protein
MNNWDREMEALFEALRGDSQNFNVICNSRRGRFELACQPQPELVRLLQANETQFKRRLRKQVIITACWEDRDQTANFAVVPVKIADPDATFETFTLPFPETAKLVTP